jgi:hypothetical protein
MHDDKRNYNSFTDEGLGLRIVAKYQINKHGQGLKAL